MRSHDAALAGFLATVLVHSTLWLAAAWLVARGLRSAVWRARLWRGAALGGVASAALALALDTTRLEWRWERSDDGARRTIAIAAPADAIGVTLGAAAPSASAPREPVAPAREAHAPSWTWTELAVGVWALGALLALARMVLERRRLARALRARRPLCDADWSADLRELARSAGLRRTPRLSQAAGLASPLALASGEIVVPARALSELARDEQRALLAHELAHLARRDPHWLVALALLERALWFQPLLRIASRRAAAAAELASDEAAARWTGAGLALARCLATVATWLGARADERVAVAMSARGSALVERVERLLAPPPTARFQGSLCVVSGALLLAALACSGPTAGEREAQAAEELAILEVLRRRIDPDGTKEFELRFIGGERIEISLPHWSARAFATEAARQRDARLEGPLALVRTCPDARIAFHVPFVDGAYASTMTAPNTFQHPLEIRADGTIWCGDMALLPPGSGDWRLLDLHLEELTRGVTSMEHFRIRADRVVIDGFPLRVEDGAEFSLLLHVLESLARGNVRFRSLAFVGAGEGAAGDPIPFRLRSPESAGVTDDAPTVTIRRASDESPASHVGVAIVWPGKPAPLRIESPEDLSRIIAALGADRPSGRTAVVDVRPGVRYGEVAPVLRALIEAGLPDLRFLDCR